MKSEKEIKEMLKNINNVLKDTTTMYYETQVKLFAQQEVLEWILQKNKALY